MCPLRHAMAPADAPAHTPGTPNAVPMQQRVPQSLAPGQGDVALEPVRRDRVKGRGDAEPGPGRPGGEHGRGAPGTHSHGTSNQQHPLLRALQAPVLGSAGSGELLSATGGLSCPDPAVPATRGCCSFPATARLCRPMDSCSAAAPVCPCLLETARVSRAQGGVAEPPGVSGTAGAGAGTALQPHGTTGSWGKGPGRAGSPVPRRGA